MGIPVEGSNELNGFNLSKQMLLVYIAREVIIMKSLFENKEVRQAIWLVSIISLILLIIGSMIRYFYFKESFGQLGDFFNGIAAPLLSLFTILLIYNSYVVQKEELKATRAALEQSTKEMQNSATIMERTEQNAKLERLESIVFKLLEKYEANRDNFSVFYEHQIVEERGERALKFLYNKYISKITISAEIQRIKDLQNPGVKSQLIDRLVRDYFSMVYSDKYYENLKSLIYKFIPIYKCILNSGISPESIEHLKFAIHVHLSDIEFFFIRLFINQLDDLESLIEDLKPFSVNTSLEALYNYLKKHP